VPPPRLSSPSSRNWSAQGKPLIVTHDENLSERTGRTIHLLDGNLAGDQENGNLP
jgi:predicted ABC-type transport system involved in lysophospholipase L1 biosynthesis ATPase subunit